MKITDYVLVEDSQTAWIARKADLVAALDSLGWKETTDLGAPARIKPDTADAYAALCNLVTVVPPSEKENTGEMTRFSLAPADHPNYRVWAWN